MTKTRKLWRPCTDRRIHARVDELFKELANPGHCEIDIIKVIRGDMNEMDKAAIAAGLDQMSVEDRVAFKAAAGEIVDVLESTLQDGDSMVAHSEVKDHGDGVSYDVIGNGIKSPDATAVKKLQGLAGDYEPCEEMTMVKGVRLRGADAPMLAADDASFTKLVRQGPGPIDDNLHFEVVDASNIDRIRAEAGAEFLKSEGNEPYVARQLAEYLNATDADAIGITIDERKVGMVAHSKNSAELMQAVLKLRQPGANIDLTKAIASDIMSPTNVEGVKAAIDRQYHPAVEHTLSAAKSKHYLNAAAGWSMMNPSAHQFLWVQFYGDDTEYQVERATRTYGGVLQFTLSDQRIINVGSIDRQNTCLMLQNPKIRAIRVKSSRRY